MPAPDGATPGTALADLPVVFAGYGSAPALEYDDYASLDVTGKAELVFTHEPQERDAASRFAGRGPTVLVAREQGARRPLEGRPPVLVVQDPSHRRDDAGPGRGRGIRRRRTSGYRCCAWTGPGCGGRWANRSDAEARAIDRDLVPRSRELPDVRISYTGTLVKVHHTVRNVVGLLRGRDPARAGEAVVVGAHYDHLGIGGRSWIPRTHGADPQRCRRQRLRHGGDHGDRAGGRGSRRPFPRTLVFVAFAGEELGLLGSAHYVQDPAMPLARTVAMLNLDMIGRPHGRKTISGLQAVPAYQAVVDASAASTPLSVAAFEEPAGAGSSDDTSFLLQRSRASRSSRGSTRITTGRPTTGRRSSRWGARRWRRSRTIARRLANRTDTPGLVVAEAASPATAAPGRATVEPVGGGYGPDFGSIPDFATSTKQVRFADVRDGSPAARAGLRRGDVLVRFGDADIRNLYDFTFALRGHRPGDQVHVVVVRNGQRMEADVTLGARE